MAKKSAKSKLVGYNHVIMCSLLHKVSHDINAFNQLRTMVMGQRLGSRVACNMHRFLVKLSVKKFSYFLYQCNITSHFPYDFFGREPFQN